MVAHAQRPTAISVNGTSFYTSGTIIEQQRQMSGSVQPPEPALLNPTYSPAQPLRKQVSLAELPTPTRPQQELGHRPSLPGGLLNNNDATASEHDDTIRGSTVGRSRANTFRSMLAGGGGRRARSNTAMTAGTGRTGYTSIVAEECVEGYSRGPSLGLWKTSRGTREFNPLGLPGPLSWRQVFYVGVIQGVGAAFIDGAANVGIAYAMYKTGAKEVYMWPLTKNTLAGDCAVTIFIQGILTFVIASSMVHVDMRTHKMDAFPFPWPDPVIGRVGSEEWEERDKKHSGLWTYFHREHGLGRGFHFFSGSAANDLFDFSLKRKEFFQRLFWSVWKGSVLSAFFFFLMWPITIAAIAPRWGGVNMAGTWTPVVIKGVYAFVYGLLQNPVVACIALGSEDAVSSHRREVKEARHQARLKERDAEAGGTFAGTSTNAGFRSTGSWRQGLNLREFAEVQGPLHPPAPAIAAVANGAPSPATRAGPTTPVPVDTTKSEKVEEKV